VAEIEVLVVKGAAVDGLSTGSVTVREVSSLAHEPGNDAVEAGSLKALSLSLEAQLLEVFDRLWDRRAVQAHFDAASIGSVNVDIKVNRLGDFGIGGSSAQQTAEEIEVQLRGRRQLSLGGCRGCKRSDRARPRKKDGRSDNEEGSRNHGIAMLRYFGDGFLKMWFDILARSKEIMM
jgi:hypothetical protein